MVEETGLHEMLAFLLEKDAGLTKSKARTLASYFDDLKTFVEVSRVDLLNLRGIRGRIIVRLSSEEIEKILKVANSGYIDLNKGISLNYLSAISRAFTKRQLDMINSLSLDKLSPNPFLIHTLNLKTPEELIRINVFMVTTRSIVTSMGFFVENLLQASSSSVEKVPRPTGGWDLIKTDKSGNKHWIQVKSGPNDMDKDQIVTWTQKIKEKITEGDKAYIGITYGKKSNQTITFNLMRQWLPKWEMRTLVGKELWDFVSDDPNYHSKLFKILTESAYQILKNKSIYNEIDLCCERLVKIFISKYGNSTEGVLRYIDEIF